MASFNLSVIYLGNMADLDPDDGDGDAENQSALIGTYYDASDRAADHIYEIVANDANNDGLINSNDTASPDTITYDLGAGPVVTQYDALFNVDARVTFPDTTGEPDYVGLGGIIQTEAGDLFFVMIDDGEGFGTNSFDDFPIESIQVTGIQAFGSQSMAMVSNDQSFVPCFAAGTRIDTQRGAVAVEHLRVGDQVQTLDNGWQPVVWTGSRRMPFGTGGPTDPIEVVAGSLGDGYPAQDLVVSSQHRLMIGSRIADRMFGNREVLVPAVKLLAVPGVRRVRPPLGVQYHHFACAAHEVVWANGTPAETLYFGPLVRATAPTALRREMGWRARRPARPMVQKGAVLRRLAFRHLKNGLPLVSL